MAAKKSGKGANCFNYANLDMALKKGVQDAIQQIAEAIEAGKRICFRVVSWLHYRKDPRARELLSQIGVAT